MNVSESTTVTHPSFHEAKTSFEEFLSSNGVSSKLHWVFQEDVVVRNGSIFVKVPIPSQNDARAEACYELGWQRNFGVALDVLCLLNGRPCGYIVIPENDRDAELMMMSSSLMKLSVPSELREAVPIKNLMRWLVLRLRSPRLFGLEAYVPSKKTLLPEYRVSHEG
jgi:hypothetical protein